MIRFPRGYGAIGVVGSGFQYGVDFREWTQHCGSPIDVVTGNRTGTGRPRKVNIVGRRSRRGRLGDALTHGLRVRLYFWIILIS